MEQLVFDADFTNLTAAEVAAGEFTEDSTNAATVTLGGDEWAYVRPVTSGILGRAELLLQANDGNEGHSPKWADRSGNDHHAQLGSAAGADTDDPEWLPFTMARSMSGCLVWQGTICLRPTPRR